MATVHVRYVHKIAPRDTDVSGPHTIPDVAFSDKVVLGKALRQAGILCAGARVRAVTVEADRVCVFPTVPGLTTYWHCVVLTLESGVP